MNDRSARLRPTRQVASCDRTRVARMTRTTAHSFPDRGRRSPSTGGRYNRSRASMATDRLFARPPARLRPARHRLSRPPRVRHTYLLLADAHATGGIARPRNFWRATRQGASGADARSRADAASSAAATRDGRPAIGTLRATTTTPAGRWAGVWPGQSSPRRHPCLRRANRCRRRTTAPLDPRISLRAARVSRPGIASDPVQTAAGPGPAPSS